MQQPHDLTRVSLTARGAVALPALRRAVLPLPLVPQAQAQQQVRQPGASSSASGSDSDSDEYDCELPSQEELHHNGRLVLALAAGCGELRELELVQWALPPAVTLAVAAALPRLRLLAAEVPADAACAGALRAAVAALRGRRVKLDLQQRLVLSSFPWHRVLAMR